MSVTSLTKRIALAVCGLALIAGCGSSSHSSSDSTTISAATPPTIDSCLVGKWKATGGSESFQTTGDGTVTVTGGPGELITFEADGRFTDDNTNAGPSTGSAGADQYSVTTTGVASGRFSTTGGVVTLTPDDPDAVTITVYENGTQVYTQHAHEATAHYTCGRGVSLTYSEGSGANSETGTYVPVK
jgi:hypothetical protein